MFDAQTPIFALAALSAVVLALILPSALIEAHSERPTWLSRHGLNRAQRLPRSSLVVEIPIVILLIGGTQLVMVVALIGSASGVATRLIGASEIVFFAVWMVHLIAANPKVPAA